MTHTPPSYVDTVYRSMNNTNEFMLIFYCKRETFPDQSVYLSEFGLQNTINNYVFPFAKLEAHWGAAAYLATHESRNFGGDTPKN